MMGQLNHDQGEFFYSFRLDEVIASGSRRCLPTSNASCDLADLDCAARAAHKMSSHWAPLHRTSAALQNSSLDRRQQLRCALRVGVGRQLLLIKSRRPSMDG